MGDDSDETDSNRVYLSMIATFCKPTCTVSRAA